MGVWASLCNIVLSFFGRKLGRVKGEKKKKIAFIWSREINIEANVKSEVFWLKPYRG